VRTPPMCRRPVGLGAKRVITGEVMDVAIPAVLRARIVAFDSAPAAL
jgi:hypothetical protein